ncbi:MAG: HD domain-containing protein [Candidatus Marinimicrobia bacterium]|nr:HD domain-containing protein [Candidatus Neomarinimicrobiota bacterium]
MLPDLPMQTSKLLTRRQKPRKEDIRGPYFRDQTAILHSFAFRRLKHKTQVFFSPDNDHICTRIEHSLHLSTIAATICKALGLNLEIAQAAGLGHDLGHAPFGHCGESTLKVLSDNGFQHELHSLRVIDKLEEMGQGLNLTFAVRDAIVSHCGEQDEQYIEVAEVPNDLDNLQKLPASPSTWEGCVLRISDSIAYLGRDMEDAIHSQCISRNDIPVEVVQKLGPTNSQIIKSLVNDCIDWSMKKGKIGLSEETFGVIKILKNFSRSKIYKNPKLEYWNRYADFVLKSLYNYLIELLGKNEKDFDKYESSAIELGQKFGKFIQKFDNFYINESASENLIVIDYIAGMSDKYAIKCFDNLLSTGTTKF